MIYYPVKRVASYPGLLVTIPLLLPCWFTLWTSSRFLHPYILLILIEILSKFSCLRPFSFSAKFQFCAVQDRACAVSTVFPVVDDLFIFQLALAAHNMLYHR